MKNTRPFGRYIYEPRVPEAVWSKSVSFSVDGVGKICSKPVQVTFYYPFDYYYTPVDPQIVRTILSPERHIPGLREAKFENQFYIYTLFATINPDNPEEIVRFMNEFGPLALPGEELDHWIDALIDETWMFSWVARMIECYVRGNEHKLWLTFCEGISLLGEHRNYYTDYGLYKIHPYASNPEDEFEIVVKTPEEAVRSVINYHLANIHPVLSFSAGTGTYECSYPTFGWRFKSLLSAMYFMLHLDLSQGRCVRRCANELCGRFFTAFRPDKEYCSIECQTRAKQRRSLSRKAEAERLYASGLPIEEIERILESQGAQRGSVRRWIAAYKARTVSSKTQKPEQESD